METTSSYLSVDAATLAPIVRRATQRERLQVGEWRVSQLGGGVGNPVSVGLYRFEGAGRDEGESVPWSVILKVIQSPANAGWTNMGEGDDPTHWNYWKREARIYSSGLLDSLPEGLIVPRCFGAAELPGNFIWLWLEDIRDSDESPWPLERYALTARHLGRLNGIYAAGRPLPGYSWLSVNRTRQWLGGISWKKFPWEHPLARAHYPEENKNHFRHLLLEHERFVARLGQLPKTLCHGDTYPTNFKSRRGSSGHAATIALDWALTGIETLGDDLGQFVFGAQVNLKGVEPATVDQALFESYLDGLRDSNCHIDPNLVRFGCVTSAALRVGLFQLAMMQNDIDKDQGIVPDMEDQPDAPARFAVTLAEQAWKLLDSIP